MILADIPYEQDFDMLRNRLAVESFGSSTTLEIFRRIVPKASELLKSYLPSLTDASEQSSSRKLDSKLYREVVKAAGGFNFLTYSDTLVAVPEGFKGKLLPYLTTLTVHNEKIIQEALGVLTDYVTELAMFLSNADIRQALKSQEMLRKALKQKRDEYRKLLDVYFEPKNHTVSRRPLDQVMDRFSDLDKIFSQAEKLQAIQKKQDYKTLVSEVQNASDLLGLIRQRTETNDIGTISKPAAQNIAEGAYEVARYVELISVFAYHTETALGSVNNIAEQLQKLFNIR